MLRIEKRVSGKCLKIRKAKMSAQWIPIKIYETENTPEIIDGLWKIIVSVNPEDLIEY